MNGRGFSRDTDLCKRSGVLRLNYGHLRRSPCRLTRPILILYTAVTKYIWDPIELVVQGKSAWQLQPLACLDSL
jgi:hypothetical protein